MKRSLAIVLILATLFCAVLSGALADSDLESLIADGDYSGAIRLCKEDGSEAALAKMAELQNSVYTMAKSALDAGDPIRAAVLFVQLEDYADAADWAFFASSNREWLVPYEVGGFFTFGRYEQDGNEENGPEPLEWLVLDDQDGKVLLLSRYVLDTVTYSASAYSRPSWEKSALRSWMNEAFAASAFTDQESALLIGDPDPVFALTGKELNTFLPAKSARKAIPTVWAKNRGVWTSGSGYCYWWLKDLNAGASIARFITTDGSPAWYHVTATQRGVRPAIRIDLWANAPAE